MSSQLLEVLIEGFDPSQLKQDQESKDWEQIYSARQNDSILQSTIKGIETMEINNKTIPCGVIYVGKVKGIVPLEFADVENEEELRQLTGLPIVYKVVNLNQEAGVFTANRKAAREHMANVAWKKLKVGLVTPGVVRRVSRESLVVDIGGIEARLPAMEYDHGWIDDLRDRVKVGEHLSLKVIQLDAEEGMVKVSAKALKENIWDSIHGRFSKGNEYLGEVSGVVNYGIFVNLAPGVDALCPHMKFNNVQKGDQVLIRIRDISRKEQRIRGSVTRFIY